MNAIRGPAVRGRAEGSTGTATAANSGFTQRSSLCSSLGLRQPARRSLRLLKAEAQASCPSRRFVNPRAVIRNGRFGEECLKNRAAEQNQKRLDRPRWKWRISLKIIRRNAIHPRRTSRWNLPVKSPLARKANRSPPDATPKAAFLVRSWIADIKIAPPDPTPIHPYTMPMCIKSGEEQDRKTEV